MKYFARKFGFFLATLWAVVTLNFLIPRLQPGDPAEIMVKQLAGKDAAARPGPGQGDAGHARRADGSLWQPVLGLPRRAGPRQLRAVLHATTRSR